MNKKNVRKIEKKIARKLTLQYFLLLFMYTLVCGGALSLIMESDGWISYYPDEVLIGMIIMWCLITAVFLQRPFHYIDQTLEKTQQEREAVKQQKNDMLMYLAHDLRTPLTSVLGYLTLLDEEPDLPQEVRKKYTGVALEKAERLEELLEEFFDITKLNLTEMVLEKEKRNFSRMLEQILFEFEPLFQEKNLKMESEIIPDVYMQCDADKMQRVFDNLLKNAVNYSKPGTELFFAMRTFKKSLKTEGKKRQKVQQSVPMVSVSLRNQGENLSKENLTKIFDQFYRSDSARKTRNGGAGLGLAIAKEIVELHHGTIYAESEAGETIFTVELPLEDSIA